MPSDYESNIDQSHGGSRGIFDGFEAYRTPTEADYYSVLTEGLVVPDTNVLLNLYRYSAQTQADLFAVFSRLTSQLWIPHQVLTEFWRNREVALRDPKRTAAETSEALESCRDDALKTLRTWANRVAWPRERLDTLLGPIEHGFSEATDVIATFVDDEYIARTNDTNSDPVLEKLGSLVRGCVGEPFDPESYDAAIREGGRRAENEIPPGYKDKKKGGNDPQSAAGDYLVWEQVLCEATRRRCDVLLVTGDVKEDWWRRAGGDIQGPRVELARELRERTGQRLYMLRPESLLRHAQRVLQVDVRDESVQDVERVDSVTGAGESAEWTSDALEELLDRLATEGWVQGQAIRVAANNNGFVSREIVYELGGYESSRTLRGFTRPANRIAREFRVRGLLHETAADPLEAVYDSEYNSLLARVQASGFRIPQEFTWLLNS